MHHNTQIKHSYVSKITDSSIVGVTSSLPLARSPGVTLISLAHCSDDPLDVIIHTTCITNTCITTCITLLCHPVWGREIRRYVQINSGDRLLDLALLVLCIPKDMQNPLYSCCCYSKLLNNVLGCRATPLVKSAPI